MRPPAFAQALVAAATPTHDYEAVVGDLQEEYLRIIELSGAAEANRWYWTQTLLSMPSLLSYSRSHRSPLRWIGITLIAFVVLVAMLIAITAIEMLMEGVFGVAHIPDYVPFCISYANVIVFGAVLAWLVRTDGIRIAFFSSLFLALCFIVPALAGHPGSQAPPVAWILLVGVIPVMCVGAALYQAARFRNK